MPEIPGGKPPIPGSQILQTLEVGTLKANNIIGSDGSSLILIGGLTASGDIQTAEGTTSSEDLVVKTGDLTGDGTAGDLVLQGGSGPGGLIVGGGVLITAGSTRGASLSGGRVNVTGGISNDFNGGQVDVRGGSGATQGGAVNVSGGSGATDGPLNLGTFGGPINIGTSSSQIGFFGVPAVTQPSAPVTLGDVIAALQSLGLVEI